MSKLVQINVQVDDGTWVVLVLHRAWLTASRRLQHKFLDMRFGKGGWATWEPHISACEKNAL